MGSYSDPRGRTCRFGVEHTVLDRITGLVCVNDTDEVLYVELRRSSDGRAYGARFGPGLSYLPIGGLDDLLLMIERDGRGRVAGPEVRSMFPWV